MNNNYINELVRHKPVPLNCKYLFLLKVYFKANKQTVPTK